LSRLTKLLLTGALALSSAPAWVSPAAAQVVTTPDRVDLSRWQTGIRNQQDRNLCSGFAMVAAIEARYRRQWGVTLDLSEQYFWHVYKSTGVEEPAPFRYENQSSFWGGGGAWGLDAARTYAIPTETAAPYLNQSQMDALRDSIPGTGQLAWAPDPSLNTVTQDQVDAFEYSERYIPRAAGFNARYGVTSFTNYGSDVSRNPSEVERLLASDREVIVGLDLNWRWNADRTARVWDPTVNEGQHVFVIVGYDRPAHQFIVKNSWGEAGPIRVDYDVIANSSYEAATVDDVPNPNTVSSTKGRLLGTWNVDFDGHRGRATIRRSTGFANDATRLGSFRFAGETVDHAVNGNTTNGGRDQVLHRAHGQRTARPDDRHRAAGRPGHAHVDLRVGRQRVGRGPVRDADEP
jgi:hypothetical protein